MCAQRSPPPAALDIAAYTEIFRPTTSTAKALTALASNAKKDSVRADVARHLRAHYHPPAAERGLVVPRNKNHVNPYFDLWAWTNQTLEWAGPDDTTASIKHSHAILPILYHHFGCVCPSYESLELIRQLARGRRIVDLGSGNGYWTYMLRRIEPANKKEKRLEVVPVDNGMSEWRVMWVGDTAQADGEQWLKQNHGAVDAVLLLVYPSVGNDFTSKMIRSYRTCHTSLFFDNHSTSLCFALYLLTFPRVLICCLLETVTVLTWDGVGGTTIISAGAQNSSGFTAFATETIAEWMAREMPEWEKVLQIPLPSFAGKDEALFVFEKKAADGTG